MLPSATNRFSVLREEAPDPEDLRIEMEDLQALSTKIQKAQLHEMSGVSHSDVTTFMNAPIV